MGSLFGVRLLALSLALTCVTLSFGQTLTGSYKGGGATPVDWSINPHQTLIWGGAPYLPIGMVSDSDRNSLSAMKTKGISDVIVDLPAAAGGWREAISALEEMKMRYLIRISSLTPMAEGVAVDPASYRITNASGNQHIDIPLPGATQALVVSALKRDGSLLKWTTVPVNQDRLVCDFKVPGQEAIILIYPTEISLEQPDFWEGLDTQRDHLLQTLKANPTGAGLRGFVNPLGQTIALPGRTLKFVPQSAGFRSEFATFLETKYRNVVGALRAWSMPSGLISSNETGDDKKSIVTFDEIARFIPLWSGTRGIGQVFNAQRGVLYQCDSAHSAIWKDIAACISAAQARRYERMVSAIREIDDVPVVQEWSGWSATYEGENPSVDGVGMKAKGSSPSAIASTAAKATSSDLRWSRPGWLPGTDIDVESSDAAGKISSIVDDLTSLGARGIFFRAKSDSLIKEVAETSKTHGSDVSASQGSPSPIYFPENATNPAETQRLAGGFWWLPAPYDGDRIDFGDGFFGYRMLTPKGITLTVWSDRSRRVMLKMASTKNVTAANFSGLTPDFKIEKDGVELTLNESPLVISNLAEIPVPEPAYQQTMTQIIVLLQEAQATHRDLTQATMMITDAKLAYERNPGGAFLTLRKLMHELDAFMGRFTWAELELPIETNFSEIAENPGCSNNQTINLHPLIDSPSGFFATYDVPVHTAEDQEVWLAARINPEDRPYLTLDIAGQHLSIKDSPVGLYGEGYGWYHLGTTKNAVGIARFKLLVSGGNPDISADAVLFAPPGFQPTGLNRPEIPVDITTKPQKTSNRRKHGQPIPSGLGE